MSVETIPSILPIYETYPSFGGAVCVALEVHSDFPLPKNRKLRVLENNLDTYTKALKSACWAYTEMPNLKAEHAMAAYVCIIYNLVAKDDGDSISSDSELNYEDWIVEAVGDLITELNLKRALTAIISTKINFWEIGNHIGNLTLKGHAEKVANTLYNMVDDNKKEITELFNTIGHWASTIKILNSFNFKELKKVHDYENVGNDTLELDVKSHFLETVTIFPAGTSKHADSYEICKLLSSHPLVTYIPNISSFFELDDIINDIKMNPVFYHEKADYLTGTKCENFNDNFACKYLGRLAPFVFYCYPDNHLVSSKNISELKYGRRFLNCSNYSDYDKDWKTVCKKYQLSKQLPIGNHSSQTWQSNLNNFSRDLISNNQKEEEIQKFKSLFS